MPPRIATNFELEYVASQIEPRREEMRQEALSELYSSALEVVHARSQGVGTEPSPLNHGAFLITNHCRPKNYRQDTALNEVVELRFMYRQTALVQNDADKTSHELHEAIDWDSIDVEIIMEIRHPETHVSEEFPIGKIGSTSVKWAETDVDGQTTWEDLDVIKDTDKITTLKDTLDFALNA